MRVRDRSFVIMLGQGTTQASGIAAGVVLVRLIGQGDFGTYRQVLLVYTTVAALLSLQLDQSLYYFVPKLASEGRRALVAQSLAAATGLAFLGAAVLFAGAGPIAGFFDNPPLARLLRIFSLFPFAEGIAILVPAFMIGLDRAVRGAVYTMVKALVRLCGVVTVFALGGSIESVLWVVIAISGAVALVGSLDMLRLGGAGAFRVRRSLLTEQLGYSLPLWMSSVVATLHLQYDKVLISTAFDPATYAVYFCGAVELPVVVLVTASITAAVMPRLVTLISEGHTRDALVLWQEGIRKASLVLFPCFAFFLPVSRDFMVLLYGEDYAGAAGPFAIYLCVLPLRVAVYATLFRAIGRTRPIAVTGLISLTVNVIASTGLVVLGRGSYLAFIGPSIGTVLAEITGVLYMLVSLRAATGIPVARLMRWRELGSSLLPCVAAGLAIYALTPWVLPPLPVAARLGVQLAAFGALLAAIVLATGQLKPDERELLRMPFAAARRLLRGRPDA